MSGYESEAGTGMKPYYQDDSFTLYNGNCRELPEYLTRGDLFVTDPPYSRAGAASSGRTNTANRSSEVQASDQFWFAWFEDVARRLASCTKADGCGFVFCDYRTVHLIERAFAGNGLGWTVSQCLVWNRMAMGLGSPFRASHELIAFVRGPKFKHEGPRNIRNVLDVYWPYGEHEHHNAEKPVELLVKLIEPFSQPGDVVLDLFAGSGSTLVAAKAIGRRAVAVEMEEGNCAVVVERLRQSVLPLTSDPTQAATAAP